MNFSTADLCDEHGEKVEILNEQFNAYGAKESFYGEMVTIKLDEDNRGLVEMLRDEDGKGRVAVVDVEKNFCAVVGDNLMGFASKNGWAGIIINGYVRDTNITKNIDVGLFALGTCPRRSSKRAEPQRGIALNFAGVEFKSGEWIYADVDGVILSENELELVEI